MRLRELFIFLTLVVVFMISAESSAAPSNEISPAPIHTKSNPKKAEPPSPDLTESTQITPTTPIPKKWESEDLFPTRALAISATTVFLGYWMGSLNDTGEMTYHSYLSLARSFYENGDHGQELELSLTDNSLIGWQAGYKWLRSLGEHWEPFYQVTLGALYSPQENLATLVNWKRYQIRGTLGLEDILSRQRQFCGEISLLWSGFGLSYQGALGYSF